jgi:mRNA interferase MazF
MLPFPFSDLSRNKLRPAVLLGKASRQDWIVCQITSNPFGDPRSLLLSASDFATGTLDHSSYVRPGKIFTAHESLIAATIGTLSPHMLQTIRRAVIDVIKGA